MKTGLRDLLLPIAVVAVVGMMIFPLPPAVLDLLLMINISFALILLVNSVYLAEPEKFTVLPSILLLTTLFRLGLNISTTRQILSTGKAPDVVSTFGNFVVGGNLVVGVVVFSIITLVQFLVIAKGAERVAEVAARFTLDAMPGKQMSIDADVRAGVINLNEARERRADLHRESKLFGALDGAMKFVKGDAIAGLVITLINISGGLFVGVKQQGLSLLDALAKYTIFTVGDGLASQIPALLVSVAAGIAVTRVGDKTNSFIGRDVFTQLVREPQALGTTSAMLFGLGLVPGLPAIPFMGMAGVAALGAFQLKKKLREQASTSDSSKFSPKIYSALLLKLSNEAALALKQERKLPELYQKLRIKTFENIGVLVPDLQFELNPHAGGVQAQFLLHGVVLSELKRESALQLSAEIIHLIERDLLLHLAELVDDTQTRMLLEIHQPIAGDMINNLVPATLSVTALTLLLRALVQESVSIRELSKILQAVSEHYLEAELQGSGRATGTKNGHGTAANGMNELLAKVRIALRRKISQSVCERGVILEALVLAPELDHLLSRLSRSGAPISAALIEAIVEQTRKLSANFSSGRLVLLATPHARAALAELLRVDFKHVVVLAAEELAEDVEIAIVGEVKVPGLALAVPDNKVVPLQAEAA